MASAYEWLERLRTRFQPCGILTTLEDPRLGLRIMLANTFVPPLLTLLTILASWALDEPEIGWVLVAFLLAQLSAGVLFVRTGRARQAVLVQLCTLLAASTACHVLLGGYLWSGGSLLYGIAVCAGAALFVGRRATVALLATCLVVAVALAPLEPVLQDRRDQPLLGLSVFVMVSLYVAVLLVIVPPTAALVDRLRLEQGRTRALMLNVLPASIADRLKAGDTVVADHHPACTIVFADLSGFTAHAESLPATQVVHELNVIVTRFDALVARHGAEKIKTMGDGYLAACGLPDPDPDHVRTACGLALDLREAMDALNTELGTSYRLRVGIHTGPAVAGVIGTTKFAYDVWGDTVNVASRLESTGVPGAVAVSEAVALRAAGSFTFEPVGTRELKGHGSVTVFHLLSGAPVGIAETR
jgi:adenylate cyclase